MDSKLTITEALAEIKTIGKRIDKKREFVLQYLLRQEMVKDPLERQGGSPNAIADEVQAIHDLQARLIKIRSRIQASNMATQLTIGNATRSITDWLTWRKEVAPLEAKFVATVRQHVESTRTQARSKGVTVGQMSVETRPTDIIVNIDEKQLAADAEQLETTLGVLDGKLSLLNATTTIEV